MSLNKRILLAVIATAFLLSGPAFGLTITSPANNARLPAGPDFATDVLGDPWDMNNPEDIGLDPSETVGWTTNFSVNSPSHPGLAGGTTATNDTQLSLLFRGFYGIINPGKNGRNFPIDTSKYQKLSFRMSSTLAGEDTQVYWFHTPWLDPSAPPIGGNGSFGHALPGKTIVGFKTFVVDLTTGSADAAGGTWTNGVVRGLRLDPNNTASGQDVFFDWVRLTAADNAPGAALQSITWTGGSGTATIDVIDAFGTVLNIASAVNSPFNWNYGILPPGGYQLRVTTGLTSVTMNFSINSPPLIQVTDPNATGGADYATTVLGNAWDMNSAADIQLTGSDNITNVSFTNGLLNATNTTNDPNITLLNQVNNAIPIDTTKYRFLTYTMQVDGPFDLANGSVARVFWDSHSFFNGTTATTTKDIIVFPGMNTYTIDLGALTTGPDGGLETTGGAEAWVPGSKTQFRFDPHEFSAPRTFHIDNVKLAAMAETNGQFIIRFAGSDADPGDSPTVTLYYDTDKDPANGKTQIVSGLALATGQYTWNTAGVAPGVYYIYAEVSDGIDTRGSYSTGQLRVFSATAPGAPAINAIAPGSGSVTISFTPPSNNGGSTITSYTATCTPVTGNPVAASAAASPLTVPGLTNGMTYTCTIHATNSVGNGPESAPSNPATPTVADSTPPTTPTGLTAVAVSASAINLSWTGSTDSGGSGLAGYKVERCLGSGCTGFVQIATAAATAYADSGLSASTTYSYRVRAYDNAGNNSGYSNTAAAPTAASTTRLVNIATRGLVLTGNNVMIGGIIIGGSSPKTVLIRAVGPSMASLGVAGVLANPMLQLYSGQTVIASNDDWGSAANAAAIQATGLAPGNALEAAILITLAPGAYTAIVSGSGGGTGVGLVEVFEVDHPEVPLVNLATRGQVQTGDNVMIGGFIIQGDTAKTVLIRAVGPSMASLGVPGVLANPLLQLYSGQTVIASNDDWGSAANAAAIQATGLAPGNALEAAILITLAPGAYTAIVTGSGGGTGVGLVEVFPQ